jgi:hypothetical protein
MPEPVRPRAFRAAVCLALALSTGVAPARAADEAPPLPDSRWRAFQTGVLRADRLQHASLAFTLGLGAGIAGREPAGAFAAAAGLGLVKELVDRRADRFDWGDLAADFAGAGLAALATRSLER